MSRAEAILTHPLARTEVQFKLLITESKTGQVTKVEIEPSTMPEEALIYLATKMRPIIFLDQDPISLSKLTSTIEREHPAIRGTLKPLRSSLETWKKQIYFAMTMVDADDDKNREQVWVGPAGTVPEWFDPSETATDFYYANVYFNSEVWHGDTNKALEYQAATPIMQAHIVRCAEARTIGAIHHISRLYEWILQAREVGADF